MITPRFESAIVFLDSSVVTSGFKGAKRLVL